MLLHTRQNGLLIALCAALQAASPSLQIAITYSPSSQSTISTSEMRPFSATIMMDMDKKRENIIKHNSAVKVEGLETETTDMQSHMSVRFVVTTENMKMLSHV